MGAIKDNYAGSGDSMVFIPKASTDIYSGDVVVMPRKCVPKSRARLGALNYISPIGSADAAPWVVGVADSDFLTTTVGATLYAAPTSSQAIEVYRRGVVYLSIVSTSGTAGQMIKYSSGAAGSQLFDVTAKAGEAIGVLEKSFSGATANDKQLVRLIEKDMHGIDIAHFLENRVLLDCTLKAITGSSQSCIAVGYTLTGNRQANMFVIQGKYFNLARNSSLAVGKLTGGAVSVCKARMIVARSGGFGYRTCSGGITLTAYTVTGFSNKYFVPTTQTSGEIAIGYVVFASAVTKASAGMLVQVKGPIMLPLGQRHWAL